MQEHELQQQHEHEPQGHQDIEVEVVGEREGGNDIDINAHGIVDDDDDDDGAHGVVDDDDDGGDVSDEGYADDSESD